jgi:phage-related tail protein
MINVLPLTIEILVAILLLFTILYCIRLNKQISRLKSDEKAMQLTISELVTATATAERAIAGLKATVREADQSLSEQLKTAERYNGEIQANMKAGAAILSRLAQVADARSRLLGNASTAEEAKPVTLDTNVADPKAIVAAAQALADRARARKRAFAA